MFMYKHRDGRVGLGPGAWFAIKDALGKEEAGNLVELSEEVPWEYKVIDVDEPGVETMVSVRQMPCIVEGEEMGMYHEVTPKTTASSKKRNVTANKDEHIDSRLSGDDKGHEPLADTLENGIEGDRKSNDDQVRQPIEKNLRDWKVKGPNSGASGITEKRLNEAKTTLYPHRNEEAWARTGDKRQVNSLPEELGKASDEKKRERWNTANKDGPKRLLDEDVGKQLELPKTKIKQKVAATFNLRQQKIAAVEPYKEYLEYRASKRGGWSDRFASIREIDDELREIMSKNAILSDEQRERIDDLKEKKAELACPGAKGYGKGNGSIGVPLGKKRRGKA
jgi:hypothetical protein